ncbi:hypothetical protein H5410_002267 [Solanum commersonii]|uniref:Uncharacterized protein n=1 Tax=Solanum commersonii TaxID=4109 RepID=A0A9J6B1F0_SOLCO|nr:hypothetical protein H5410_002267 [Solanum commersonii]
MFHPYSDHTSATVVGISSRKERCKLMIKGRSLANGILMLLAHVDDMEWKCLLQSSLGPNMHIKPKVGAAGDIIYFIYSLLLKSGLLTLHVLDVIKKIKIPRIYHV